ncbi:MAG: superoxide dismutase family protein [Christensenellales bacterium]
MFFSNDYTKAIAHKIDRQKPGAVAEVRGSANYPQIKGTVSFYPSMRGTLVVADVSGLPYSESMCGGRIFGFHIHEGGWCGGNEADPFADTKGHYNPKNCPHPQHAGDLPPLFGNKGYAWCSVLTNRFTVGDIIGRTIIIHADPDDFTTQPSGKSGEKIACGVIRRQ